MTVRPRSLNGRLFSLLGLAGVIIAAHGIVLHEEVSSQKQPAAAVRRRFVRTGTFINQPSLSDIPFPLFVEGAFMTSSRGGRLSLMVLFSCFSAATHQPTGPPTSRLGGVGSGHIMRYCKLQ